MKSSISSNNTQLADLVGYSVNNSYVIHTSISCAQDLAIYLSVVVQYYVMNAVELTNVQKDNAYVKKVPQDKEYHVE